MATFLAILRQERPFMESIITISALIHDGNYSNKRKHGKPKIKITDWILYFGISIAKTAILGPKFLPEDFKLKIPKISMPSEVEVQSADIPGNFCGLFPETSAHIHDTDSDIPHVSPAQITQILKRKIKNESGSVWHHAHSGAPKFL